VNQGAFYRKGDFNTRKSACRWDFRRIAVDQRNLLAGSTTGLSASWLGGVFGIMGRKPSPFWIECGTSAPREESRALNMRKARRKLLFGSLAVAGLAAARRYGPEHRLINSGHAAAVRRREVSTVPSWVAPLAVGEQYRIPNSSFWGPGVVAQYKVAHPDLNYTTDSGSTGFIHLHGSKIPKLWGRTAYSGAGWNPDGCEFYLFGGGHAASFGNEVLRFRAHAERPVWEVLGQPSDASAVSFCRTGVHVPPLRFSVTDFAAQAYHLDGKPASGHVCTRNFYLPGDNALWKFMGGVGFLGSGGNGQNDRFDCAARKWSTPGTYGSWASLTPNPEFRGDFRHYAVVDYRDNSVYLIKHANGGIYRWHYSSPFSVTSMESISSVYNFQKAPFFVWPTIVDEIRNCIVIATAGHGSSSGPLKIIKVDLVTNAKTLHEVTWKIPEVNFWPGNAMTHDTDGDRYLVYTGGNFFYTIDAKTLEVDVLKFTGDLLPTQNWWALNRLRYSPDLKGTLYVSNGPRNAPTHDGCSVYFVRLHK
jgi:hypothetical protein